MEINKPNIYMFNSFKVVMRNSICNKHYGIIYNILTIYKNIKCLKIKSLPTLWNYWCNNLICLNLIAIKYLLINQTNFQS